MKVKTILEILKEYYIGKTVIVYLVESFNSFTQEWSENSILHYNDLPNTHRVKETISTKVIDVIFTTDGYDYNDCNLVIDFNGITYYCEIWF